MAGYAGTQRQWVACPASLHDMSDTLQNSQRIDDFRLALDHVSGIIDQVPAEAWDNQSPCEEWSAIEVVSHITSTLGKVMTLIALEGVYEGEPGAVDHAADRLTVLERWRGSRDRVREDLQRMDPDREWDAPGGVKPMADALILPTSDLAVHSWDIAAATGLERDLPERLVTVVHDNVAGIPEERLRSAGLFGPAVNVPDESSATDHLMAYLGRRA